MAENNERSGLEHTAQAASIARGAVKAGKALAGSTQGAAFGPYGIAAGLIWENRKTVGKIIVAAVVLFLLPGVLLLMLPGTLLGGAEDDAVWDESVAEEVLFDDYTSISNSQRAACDAIDAVMESAHEIVLAEITADFAGYSEHDTMVLHDPYAASLPHDSIRILCEYSALTDLDEAVNLSALTEKLSPYKDSFFFFMTVEEPKTKIQTIYHEDGTQTEQSIPYTQVTYTIIYLGDDYITEDIFMLTDEQKELAADLADSLQLFTGGDDNAEAN